MEDNVIQINGRITINVFVSGKKVKYVKENIFRIVLQAVVNMKNDSATMYDKTIDAEAKSNKKTTSKIQNFYILLAFLLFTFIFLITVSIYCYLIKYRAKKKNIFYYFTT